MVLLEELDGCGIAGLVGFEQFFGLFLVLLEWGVKWKPVEIHANLVGLELRLAALAGVFQPWNVSKDHMVGRFLTVAVRKCGQRRVRRGQRRMKLGRRRIKT